jgi:hypothetical protein
MERSIWRGFYSPKHLPPLPCARCADGRLVLDKDTWREEEPHHSRSRQADEESDIQEVDIRFTVLLRCSNAVCGEVVAVAGDLFYEPDYDSTGASYTRVMAPKAMVPAPRMLTVPIATPDNVVFAMKRAYALYWGDLASTMSALRTSLELLLDDFHIPREVLGKDGEMRWLPLKGRLKQFEPAGPEFAQTFEAIRVVGNLGTHHDIKRAVVLDAMEGYEHALSELYGGTKDRIAKLMKKILDNNGKY